MKLWGVIAMIGCDKGSILMTRILGMAHEIWLSLDFYHGLESWNFEVSHTRPYRCDKLWQGSDSYDRLRQGSYTYDRLWQEFLVWTHEIWLSLDFYHGLESWSFEVSQTRPYRCSKSWQGSDSCDRQWQGSYTYNKLWQGFLVWTHEIWLSLDFYHGLESRNFVVSHTRPYRCDKSWQGSDSCDRLWQESYTYDWLWQDSWYGHMKYS
jgi:hypothetical protein